MIDANLQEQFSTRLFVGKISGTLCSRVKGQNQPIQLFESCRQCFGFCLSQGLAASRVRFGGFPCNLFLQHGAKRSPEEPVKGRFAMELLGGMPRTNSINRRSSNG